MKTELVMEVHPSGKRFLEVDSLIKWFETEFNDSEGRDGKTMRETGRLAALVLREMTKKALRSPNRVMTEEEYHGGEKGKDVH
jgi:hypothetical protein